MSWDKERVEKLTFLWGEGRSASQIAKELGGGVSRNAVIGKIHRLGLSDRSNSRKDNQNNKKSSIQSSGDQLNNTSVQKTPKLKKHLQSSINTDKVQQERSNNKQAHSHNPASNNKIDKETPLNKLLGDSEANLGQPNKEDLYNSENTEIDENAIATMKELEEKAKKLTLMELTEKTCKWPIGDPATEQFWFCGHPSENGKPYCETHVSIAFQPVSSRRDRKQK